MAAWLRLTPAGVNQLALTEVTWLFLFIFTPCPSVSGDCIHTATKQFLAGVVQNIICGPIWLRDHHAIFLILQSVVAAYRLNSKLYKAESAISLNCIKVDSCARVSNGTCAAIALAESTYNFGFLVQWETCIKCRASGTSADDDSLEILISGSLYVDGEILINCTTPVVAKIPH